MCYEANSLPAAWKPTSIDLTWPQEMYLWMIQISKICIQQNSIVIEFWTSRNYFRNPRIFFFIVLQCIKREIVLIEDGCENWSLNTAKLQSFMPIELDLKLKK